MTGARQQMHGSKSALSRRTVMALTGSAILGSPFVASAQFRVGPAIGFLDTAVSTTGEFAAFYDGLKVEGYVRNRTVVTIYHSAAGEDGRLSALAADLVKRQLAAITAIGVPAALAAKAVTAAIPVVFVVDRNPVEIGLVPSLDFPGGNMTGVIALAGGGAGKRLELLHELVPAATEIAFLVNSANPRAQTQVADATAAFRMKGIRLRPIQVLATGAFDSAFVSVAGSPAGGLIIADDEAFDSRAADLGFLAFHHRIPAIYQGRSFTAAGGLLSYGSDWNEIYHQAGAYIGLVLKGARAASLPIFQSVRMEFIINAKAAVSLGIAVPDAMLTAANQVMN